MASYGLSLAQFEETFRAWAEREGIEYPGLKRRNLEYVFDRVRQQAAFTLDTQPGETRFYLGLTSTGTGMRRVEWRINRAGNLNEAAISFSRRQKRREIKRKEIVKDPYFSHHYQRAIKNFEVSINRFMSPKSSEVLSSGETLHLLLKEELRKSGVGGEKIKLFDKSLQTFCLELELARRERIYKEFLGKLDPACLEQAQKHEGDFSRAYNWFNDGQNEVVRQRRMQVARLNPLVIPFAVGLVGKEDVSSVSQKTAEAQRASNLLTETIDCGASLPQAMETVLRRRNLREQPFLKSVVRFMMSLETGSIPPEVHKDLFKLLQDLSLINPNWYPRTQEGWTHFHSCSMFFHGFVEGVSSAFSLEKMFQETGGKWKEFATLVEEAGGLSGIEDWQKSIRNKIVLPVAYLKGGDGTKHSIYSRAQQIFSQHAFYKELSILEIAEASRRWHAQIAVFTAKLNNLAAPRNEEGKIVLNWHPLSEPLRAPNGILCKPLTTPAELEAQHVAQDHCVNTFSSNCLLGNSHIVSLERDGVVLTTVELREEWKNAASPVPERLRISQHQGYKRRRPFPEEEEAVAWYMQSIRPEWDKISAGRMRAKELTTRVQAVLDIGFDPVDLRCREAAFLACRPYFPTASQRNMDYRTWCQHFNIPGVE